MSNLESKQRFSLRKLSFGLASVMIGLSFFNAENKTVKADTIGDANSVKTEVVSQKAPAKTEVQTDSSVQNNSQIGKTSANSDQTAVSTGESDKNNGVNNPATQDNPDKTNTVDASSEMANSNADAEIKQHTQSLLKTKLNVAAIKTKALNKNLVNANALTENKAETVTPDYTPAIDAWTGSVDSQGYYELTGYDASKDSNLQNNGIFSIPNAADFAKAGKSTRGKQVGITRDGIHAIFKANADKIKDLHFSDTDNQKIKAIGSNWSYAFSLNDNYGYSNIQKVTGNGFDTSNVINMNSMFKANQISDLTSLANWKVDNVTDMHAMFESNQISDLTPLANWKVDNVTDMNNMFNSNQISDLTPLANWKVDNVTNMYYMFSYNKISNLTSLSNWKVDNVNNMNGMFESNQISDLTPLANWKVDKVIDMSGMFESNQISDLTSLSNWKVNNVTDMNNMFYSNQIRDLIPLANWKVANVTDMSSMFYSNQIRDLTPLSNWKVDKVTDMNGMFESNQISDLTPLANWKVDNVTDMSSMFFDNKIGDLTPLSNWKVDNVTDMSSMFFDNKISDLTPLANWKVDNVTDMNSMFDLNQISNLTPLANWKVDNVTNMHEMFESNQISDLTPLANWKVDNVTDMNNMFDSNQISDLIPLANWKVDNVTDMHQMFQSDPIKYADFSKWSFNTALNRPVSWSSDGGLNNFIDSSYPIIYLGANTTLPDWVLDHSDNNDQVFSNPDHAIIITTNPKLLANPNKSFNEITITNQDGNTRTYQTPVFVNATSLEEAKKIIKQDIQDQISAYNTTNPNRTVALDVARSFNINDPLNGLAYLANSFYTSKHNTKTEIDYNPAKRTITIYNPDGTVSTYVQTIGYKRDKIIDLVTNGVTYGTYTLDDPTSSYTINGVVQTAKSYRQDGSNVYFNKIKIPVIPGYKAVIDSNNGIMVVSYKLLALPKQDHDSIKITPSSDSTTTISPVQSTVTIAPSSDSTTTTSPVQSTVTIVPQWTEQDDSISYEIKKDNLNVIVPKLDNYEFHLTDSKQNTLAFTYTNSMNTYKFSLSYDLNGRLILHVESKGLNQNFVIKDQANLLKLIKSIVK